MLTKSDENVITFCSIRKLNRNLKIQPKRAELVSDLPSKIIFKSNNRLIIDEIMSNFGLFKPSVKIAQRIEKFNVFSIFQSVLMLRH